MLQRILISLWWKCSHYDSLLHSVTDAVLCVSDINIQHVQTWITLDIPTVDWQHVNLDIERLLSFHQAFSRVKIVSVTQTTVYRNKVTSMKEGKFFEEVGVVTEGLALKPEMTVVG